MKLLLALVACLFALSGCGTLLDASVPQQGPAPQQAPTMMAPQAGGLAVGSRVAARWKDGMYYPGQIAALEGDRLSIAYDDGDALVVGQGDVFRMAAPGSLTVGAHVLAVWTNGKMYPGVITALGPGVATVRWDDGDVPLVVPDMQIAPLGAASVAAPPAPQLVASPGPSPAAASYPGLPVGTPVAAKWTDGKYWLGQIVALQGAGYRIHYGPGAAAPAYLHCTLGEWIVPLASCAHRLTR